MRLGDLIFPQSEARALSDMNVFSEEYEGHEWLG